MSSNGDLEEISNIPSNRIYRDKVKTKLKHN